MYARNFLPGDPFTAVRPLLRTIGGWLTFAAAVALAAAAVLLLTGQASMPGSCGIAGGQMPAGATITVNPVTGNASAPAQPGGYDFECTSGQWTLLLDTVGS